MLIRTILTLALAASACTKKASSVDSTVDGMWAGERSNDRVETIKQENKRLESPEGAMVRAARSCMLQHAVRMESDGVRVLALVGTKVGAVLAFSSLVESPDGGTSNLTNGPLIECLNEWADKLALLRSLEQRAKSKGREPRITIPRSTLVSSPQSPQELE
jgi:hypothetical protein